MDKICRPALIYLVIALIMLAIGVIIKFDSFNLGATCGQFSSIILCTIILAVLCNLGNIGEDVSWVITTIFILCTLSGIVAMVMNLFAPPPTVYIAPTNPQNYRGTYNPQNYPRNY